MIFAITKAHVIKLIITIKNLIKNDNNASCIVSIGISGLSESDLPTR